MSRSVSIATSAALWSIGGGRAITRGAARGSARSRFAAAMNAASSEYSIRPSWLMSAAPSRPEITSWVNTPDSNRDHSCASSPAVAAMTTPTVGQVRCAPSPAASRSDSVTSAGVASISVAPRTPTTAPALQASTIRCT